MVLGIAGMRRLWLERNARTFDRKSSSMTQIVAVVVAELELWEAARQRAGRIEE